jgi:pyruvate kinase
MRRTKIVCTVGPATDSADRLRQIIAVGADILRLNFSHGTDTKHQVVARRIRAVADALGKPVAILQDLPGPKIRWANLAPKRSSLARATDSRSPLRTWLGISSASRSTTQILRMKFDPDKRSYWLMARLNSKLKM